MYKLFLKRILDLLIASIVFIIALPIFVITCLVLFGSNKGKIFYSQNRVGKDNQIFKLFKFKSMNDKKDKDGILLLDVDRITYFGKFIRKSSIDELPQLFNIFKGDMSVVGPRPLLPEYLPYYNSIHIRRHEIRPGITGLAQVSGRNTLTFGQRFNYDVKYVDALGFGLDVSILIKTFLKIFQKSEIKIGRPMSEIDDIGITKGLQKNYFNPEIK